MRQLVIGATCTAVLLLAGCSSGDSPEDTNELANPASVYCEEQGGRVDIRTDDTGGQFGVCVFDDGREVEEWAYYRGEAEPALP